MPAAGGLSIHEFNAEAVSMNYLEAILLGLVQGLSEFLPISSSGHLVIFQQLFGLSEDIAANMLFDVLVHIGTLVAVFIAFRHRIWRLIKAVGGLVADLCRGRFSFRKADEDKRMVILVLIATAVLIPFIPFRGYLEILFSSMLTVGVALLFTALLLSFADRVKKGNKTMKDMKVRDALIIGAFQGVALTPGISRSGSTITSGLLCGLNRARAVEFSFILSIPAILGSAALHLSDAAHMLSEVNLGPYIAGMAVAAAAGFAAIKLIQYLVKKEKFGVFAYYCAAMGLFVIIYSLVK